MRPLHLAVALDGAGWHPAAWREPTARPRDLFTARYWTDLVREAEAGLLDLVTIEDALRLQSDDPRRPDERTDRVRGRLDAVLLAARLALVTRHIGLVPSATATHTEPFHPSKAIATLDHTTRGRAGVRVQVSLRPDEAAQFGRRPELAALATLAPGQTPPAALVEDVFDEGRDWVEVLRRLWDSWEDDAEIRDVATGRFIDADKLHTVDFTGPHFSVRGPSITQRPPQGQPLVAALSHVPVAHRFVARSADLGFLTPHDDDEARRLVAAVRDEREVQPAWPDGVGDQPLRLLGDVVVVLDETPGAAAERLARLDAAAGTALARTSDALVFAGTPAELADLALAWQHAGLDGLRLRPAVLPDDLHAITRTLVPELQRRGVFRTAYAERTLRERLRLPRPTNRYALSSTADTADREAAR
ncbi:Flavin-dependent oxidoreductase, luciferase family (includes alkanesulfonate monooxygenase SsuD and methylene tetrahydromethanopterin reductase) [Quadrisphaera granulorum]|uniref:Alkanesulfonate monooxygenase SsuD/methylene tetrahydromethanopterin reductase-like flavin-dependent oxidoreductase (Luciferase family) n=1 Tax=Quadrisphaera granulorum TaxID=317664 RepID=A0A316A7C6_9ACTN|nr:LLM class flavin-dependent oxidoreductase [Quadrisphaera granulorum]PWJ53118.1 alkanesulfonate monooxygenase SsuD/methylene tetrahydromethanopterin reductase-like flavin-dependent oxidoreductase (luciferase family) [Quadrisphaera granulorum]SZE97050.1 Flavin-dependent oxidoreductase, luciferase family (includes alkanesulfonate monooxygenase SsuD and methylene tetrahydromethanopterin reductase) [Quadrisphaera granulorum]